MRSRANLSRRTGTGRAVIERDRKGVPQRRGAVRTVRGTTRRRRRSAVTPRRHRVLRVMLILVAVLCFMGAAGVGAVFAAYTSYKGQLPDAATVASMEPALDSHVFDSQGNLIAVLHGTDFRHLHASLDNISSWVKKATIDVEDRHFYQEGSWDVGRMVKAGWDDIRHQGNPQGASTITEQLAKVSFFDAPDRSLDYKIKEIVLGNEIDANFTKDQILEMYLNRVPYGNHAIGIETAAQLYFQKSAKDLDLAEASMLAGLPQSPSYYTLVGDGSVGITDQGKARQQIVLQAMVANGDITATQSDAAYKEKLTFHQWWDSEPNTYPDFAGLLTNWLQQNYGDSFIKPGGWNIYTTIDPGKQAVAEQSVHDGVAAIASKNAHDGSLVSLDPRTGEVLAIVGAWDNKDPTVGQLNMAIRQLQPGSTIKLFTYTAAIASHMFTMTSTIPDRPLKLNDGSQTGYSPQNYDLRYHGDCPLKICFGNSLNVPAVYTESKVGIRYITNLEIAAGLKSLEDPANFPADNQWSATLGGLRYGISPLELADGAATIADMGVHHDPMPVDHIVDTVSGKTIFKYDAAAAGVRVVPENVAFIIAEITSNDSNRVMEFGPHGDLTLPDRRVSAKTGTTPFFEDNWTVGWTPEIVTSVWVGNPTPSCLKPEDYNTLVSDMQHHRIYSGQAPTDPYTPGELAAYGLTPLNGACGHLVGSTGITGAAPIWNTYMRHALAGVKADWYKQPGDVIAHGSGDNADFFLPGTTGTNGCYYWGPPNPQSQCTYLGPTAPAAPPTPAPAAPAATGDNGNGNGNGNGHGGGGGPPPPPIP